MNTKQVDSIRLMRVLTQVTQGNLAKADKNSVLEYVSIKFIK